MCILISVSLPGWLTDCHPKRTLCAEEAEVLELHAFILFDCVHCMLANIFSHFLLAWMLFRCARLSFTQLFIVKHRDGYRICIRKNGFRACQCMEPWIWIYIRTILSMLRSQYNWHTALAIHSIVYIYSLIQRFSVDCWYYVRGGCMYSCTIDRDGMMNFSWPL